MCSHAPLLHSSRTANQRGDAIPLTCFPSSSNCVFVSEPRINSSDDLELPTSGHSPPIVLQCNLTSAQSPHQGSFWMKNGETISGMNKELNSTEYRQGPSIVWAVVPTRHSCMFLGFSLCRPHAKSLFGACVVVQVLMVLLILQRYLKNDQTHFGNSSPQFCLVAIVTQCVVPVQFLCVA